MYGLEHGATLADIGRPGETDGAGDLCCHVAEDIAVKVGHHDDVERARRVRHLGRADIDDPDFLLNVRILHTDFVEHLMEQAVGHLHDVVLHEAGDLFAIVQARILEGVAHDLLAARPRNQLDAGHDFGRHLVFDARIEVLFVLAHDHDIHIGMLGVDERMIGNARPDVGILPQGFSGGDVEALESSALRGRDGSLEEDLGP